jgi:hypothetical protein
MTTRIEKYIRNTWVIISLIQLEKRGTVERILRTVLETEGLEQFFYYRYISSFEKDITI